MPESNHPELSPLKPLKKPWYRIFALPNSASGKTAGLIWLAVVSISLTFFIAWKVPTDPDLFWHLRAGGEILKQGIPYTDWYSHTFSDFAWIDHEYGQEIFMHLVEQLGGYRLISIVYALLVAFTFTVGLKWALPKKINWVWIFLAAPYIAIFSVSFLGARPQMFTYLFVLLTVGVIRRSLVSNKLILLVWLPIIFTLWANWHASFLAGLLILLAFTSAEAIKFITPGRFKLGSSNLKKVVWLSVITSLSGLATFINFYGVRIWLEIIRTLGDKELHNNITEWFTPNIHSNNGFLFFMVLAILLLVLALKKYRLDLGIIFVLGMFTVTGFYSVRNIPLFMLFAVPIVVLAVREYWPGFLGKLTLIWPAMLILSALVPIYVYYHVPVKDILAFDQNPELAQTYGGYPLGALNFLKEHPEYAEKNAFNNYAWGGYFLYYLPEFKTFIDGRMPSWEQNGTKIIDQYFKIDRVESDYIKTIDKYNVEYFVLPADHKLFTELASNPDYKEVFSDDIAKIWAKL